MAQDTSLINLITTFVGLLLVAISVWFLYRQTKAVAEATRAGVFQNASELFILIDRLFIENPQLKKYFYGNAELEKGHPETERLWSVAELIVDVAENMRIMAPLMPRYSWETAAAYFADLYQSSQIIRDYLEKNGDWYPSILQSLFKSGLLEEE
jgi:hypothetical protein